MTELTDGAASDRLTRLEHAVRRWRALGSLAVALVAGVVLMGALGQPDREETAEIRTRAIVLVDPDRRPRMDLRVARSDSTHLVLMDREGLPRISLNVLTQGGADLVLRDQLGRPRATLSVLPDGRPGLSLYDAFGTTRVAVGMVPDDQPRVVLYDPRGQARWVSPLDPPPGGASR
ncbi:MAG TPA: hypothetical protein VHN13_22115 [Candidatus Tectomicrobia bacterium]|jgi:hypothetical protein|nr:hypothetical protein [Candidatus Tectomicrobia bacterium]